MKTRYELMLFAVVISVILIVSFAVPMAHAEVTITVKTPMHSVPCPASEPTMVKNEDGTYTRSIVNAVTAIACMETPAPHQEKWTDYPEKGGKPVARVSPFAGDGGQGFLQNGQSLTLP